MIADMIGNKKLHPLATEVFIIGRKLNISLLFITQSNFQVSIDAILTTTHSFIIKIPNKRELKQITLIIHLVLTLINLRNSSENLLLNHFHFLVIDTTTPPDNALHFARIFWEKYRQ